MDNPTTPDGAENSKGLWAQNADPDTSFGATNVFSTERSSEPADKAASPEGLFPTQEVATPKPKPLAEPLVHKVVLGANAGENSPDVLDRMRNASGARDISTEKVLVPEPGGRDSATGYSPASGELGNEGFTQLLRSLQSDQATPPIARTTPPTPSRPPEQDSGFTSLLRALNSPEPAAGQARSATSTTPLVTPFVPEESHRTQPPPAPGGFTEMLRVMPVGGTEPSAPSPEASGIEPLSARPEYSSSGENQPGAFTRLFSTLEGSGTNPPPATPEQNPSRGSSPENAGSFTRMLAVDQQSAPQRTPFVEPKPAAENLNYGVAPEEIGKARDEQGVRDPFSMPQRQDAPPAAAAPAGGVGITRLIRMLDEPVAPPVKTPEVTPFPPAPVAPGATREAQFYGSQNAPAVTPVPPVAAGPSEFTRILDASRLRELSMKGGSTPSAPAPAAPPAPAPPPMSMPSYPMPTYPQPPVMPGYGAVPQPGGYAPMQTPQMGGGSVSFGAGGGAVQMPGGMASMQTPAPPPLPPLPAAPPAPAQPGVGKMQQYVPLLLILIIFLLVGLLVTVIFLLKH